MVVMLIRNIKANHTLCDERQAEPTLYNSALPW